MFDVSVYAIVREELRIPIAGPHESLWVNTSPEDTNLLTSPGQSYGLRGSNILNNAFQPFLRLALCP